MSEEHVIVRIDPSGVLHYYAGRNLGWSAQPVPVGSRIEAQEIVRELFVNGGLLKTEFAHIEPLRLHQQAPTP